MPPPNRNLEASQSTLAHSSYQFSHIRSTSLFSFQEIKPKFCIAMLILSATSIPAFQTSLHCVVCSPLLHATFYIVSACDEKFSRTGAQACSPDMPKFLLVAGQRLGRDPASIRRRLLPYYDMAVKPSYVPTCAFSQMQGHTPARPSRYCHCASLTQPRLCNKAVRCG